MKSLVKPFTLTNATASRTDIQTSLIDSIGFFCSYCELPLSGYEIAHHKHHQAWQDTIATSDWQNLLLTCKDCREHITNEQLSESQRSNMLWPDEDATFSLDSKSPFTYEPKLIRHLVLDGNTVHKDEQRRLVFIRANPLAGEDIYRKAKNTIDHFQLNMRKDYFSEGSDTLVQPLDDHMRAIDGRIFERSKAWDEAEASIDRLNMLSAHPDVIKFPQIRDIFLDQLSTTAYFKGNWSVWMTVFNNTFPNQHRFLYRLFIKDTRYFKGIDTKKLGLQLNP